MQANGVKYLPDSRYRPARLAAGLRGFGFANYKPDLLTHLFAKQRRYGIALTRPSWTLRAVGHLGDVQILGYREMAWDGHQDVIVFGRPGVDADFRRSGRSTTGQQPP